ncbi:MAG: RNA methyltransferase [Nitrospinaceae bacterium]|jgi:tRNA/rRNA methyltransferase|nr:RNA methyltransferase [Nitrospinaceae bacterium]MBT3432790.1 RNA methyltransferase [Nitrospinaceae bacterium]MBT4093002.1 RNA methyltransferase [Nitrospinaceae bacterium]MBT4431134.1 RNA methyltransferase [Nitrospinaceae bacterium]MBT5369285.1 RNA methyltransferase [Nitrospinaceae bacterium]
MKRKPSYEKLDKFVVVLVQPKGGGNVGAIARAMSHFGLSTLRLVSPHCDPKSVEARSMAMSAQPLLARAEHFATLREALDDCEWAVATSRRLGRNRRPTMTPREGAAALLERAKGERVALVFGREDKGLRTDEVDLCQERLMIPTLSESESLNLSQAALLIFWELFSEKQAATEHPESASISHESDRLAPRDLIEGMVDHLVATLELIGFVPHHNPERVARSFRQLIDRIKPSLREVRMMRGVMRQIAWKTLHRDPAPSEDAPGEDGTSGELIEESPSLAAKRRARLIRNA